jgi:hypothetical protein
MRPPVDSDRIQALAQKLGRIAISPTVVYLTGGATAVLEGWRASTVDVDLRFEPDSDPLLRALPQLKEELQINIELASPPDFIPELPGWQERSPLVIETGNVQVRNFDRGLVKPDRLRELYEHIEPDLYRYPAIDPAAFRRKLDAALRAARDRPDRDG